MQNDIWLAIKHIKQGSKKNVTFAKIEQFTKRNKVEISTEELNRIIENSVDNVIQMQGKSQNATCRFSEQAESEDVLLMSHTQEPSSSSSQNERVNFTQNGDGEVVHRTRPYERSSKGYNLIKMFSGTCSKETFWAGRGLNNISTNKS